jgi:outer membrane protein assembly factor BamD (BamD/ComL family)
VVARLNGVAKNYSGIGLDERVAFGLYDAHLKLNDAASARAALETYARKFPNDEGAKKALRLAAELQVPATPAPTPDAGT